MKLAEALVIRADTQKRLEQVKARLLRNAKVQEGEKPAEDPQALLAEADALAAEWARLVTRINLTNAGATVLGRSMTQALADRDVLKWRHQVHRELAAAATITQTVSTKSEVRFRSAIDVSAVQASADRIAKELRELDARIQEANWTIELRE